MTLKTKSTALALLLSAAVALAGCAALPVQSASPGESALPYPTAAPSSAAPEPMPFPTARAASQAPAGASSGDADWSEQDAKAVVTLNGTSIDVRAPGASAGASAEGGVLTITEGGLYVIRGTLEDGQIVVHASSSDKVRLVLDGVNITNTTGAALYAAQADRLTLTLAEGSENRLEDAAAAAYMYADAGAGEPDAALFSKDDLTINGAGKLAVVGNFNNGIGTKDDLVIDGCVLEIDAANDALRGRDSVTVLGGALTLRAGGDGIQANNDEDSAKGWVRVEGGIIDIVAARDGIQAETALTVLGGTLRAVTGGGAASGSSGDSQKGLKGYDVVISGGDVTLDCADDALHANGSLSVSGGKLAIASGDDALHADEDLTVSDGVIEVTTCYEGMEASTMTISGGTITITSTDDGINLAGGNDDGAGGRFGRDQFAADSGKWLLISGGTVTLYAGRDAIDSNGSAAMSGGTVSLTAAMLGEGETIDVNGTWTQTGGDLTQTGGRGPGGGGMRGRR